MSDKLKGRKQKYSERFPAHQMKATIAGLNVNSTEHPG